MQMKSLFKDDGAVDQQQMVQQLGENAQHEVTSKGIHIIHITDPPDLCYWDLSYYGLFEFKTAWELVRQQKKKNPNPLC